MIWEGKEVGVGVLDFWGVFKRVTDTFRFWVGQRRRRSLVGRSSLYGLNVTLLVEDLTFLRLLGRVED